MKKSNSLSGSSSKVKQAVVGNQEIQKTRHSFYQAHT